MRIKSKDINIINTIFGLAKKLNSDRYLTSKNFFIKKNIT